MIFKTQLIDTPLGALHVRTAGTGPTILFWPSLLMDGRMWTGVAEKLVSDYQVALIDPPGHGESAPLQQHFDFTACAESIRTLADALGVARVHYVGNSWGAMVGGTFAALHPERIGCAMLMNGTAAPCGMAQRIRFQAMILLGRLLGGIRGPLLPRAVDAFLGPTSKRERPEVVATVREALGRVDFDSGRWAVESVVVRRPDQYALYRTIRTPVLVVAGEEDATFPVSETRASANAIPDATFVVMARTAHLAGLECPADTATMIREFIQQHA